MESRESVRQTEGIARSIQSGVEPSHSKVFIDSLCFALGFLRMSTALPISQLDHCSVLITDIHRSRRFYGEVLGLKEINKPRTFDFVVLWFQCGDQTVHLLLKEKPDTISPRHFALRVRDVAAARSYFR